MEVLCLFLSCLGSLIILGWLRFSFLMVSVTPVISLKLWQKFSKGLLTNDILKNNLVKEMTKNISKPRMHSCRIRTVRCSGHLGGGGGQPREGLSQHAMGQTPPWKEFLTHACENIIFLQLLLRTVIIFSL